MVTYSSKRLRTASRGLAVAGISATVVFGGLCLLLWIGYYAGERSLSAWDLLAITCVVTVVCVGLLYAPWVVCSEASATEDGLVVRTGFSLKYRVAWEQVEECIIKGQSEGAYGLAATIKVSGGLTPLHTVPVRMPDGGRRRVRGFTLLSTGTHYFELVSEIRDRLAGARWEAST